MGRDASLRSAWQCAPLHSWHILCKNCTHILQGEQMSELSLADGLERRKEDYGLITGQARFVDDLRPPKGRPQALYMAVVRSPYAHAGIEYIRLDAALAL